jgi:GR25 family glycosyltransferase involved in LPS biosynthesis
MLLLVCLTITLLLIAAHEARDQCAAVEEKAAAPHILFINMDRSPERRLHTEAWLAADPYVLSSTGISAVDASQFSRTDVVEELSTYATLHTSNNSSTLATMQARIWRFGLAGRISTLGCGLSHAKAIAVAYAMGLEEVLIIEDDVEMIQFSKDPSRNSAMIWHYLRSLIQSLPVDWSILQVFTTIFDDKKLSHVQQRITDHVLWSQRKHCSGNDYMLWGAGAYIINRKGMRQFLSQHLPDVLDITPNEAHAFHGHFDLRDSTITAVADIWLYATGGVYTSLMPLFVPAASVAKFSTITQHNLESVMTREQATAVNNMITTLLFDRVFDNNTILQEALQHTRHFHSAQLRDKISIINSIATARYAVLLELGLHGVNAETQGTDTDVQLYDVTTAAQRLQLRLHLEQSNPYKAKFWSRLIDLYFQQCIEVDNASDEAKHTTASNDTASKQLYVLVPMFHLLRAIPLLIDADMQQIQEAADTFCSFFEGSEFMLCTGALQQRLQLAVKIYG